MEEELDFTQCKYVLYARKSTEDPERQVRSIDDQIAECKIIASRLNLKIIDVLQEKKSAKKPGKRPLFKQMLNDIKSGKYDSILAWNPDRLARNMKEGGEIIDMIDDDLIIDMKFVTHHFSKDANGKMLLGMAFVLSKQYSDNLSQNVTRGVRRNFSEGKTPIPKHGYIRDEAGLYRPDNKKNFSLIKHAWLKRLEGTSLEDIADYLNSNGYSKVTKTGKFIKMTKQILTDLFKDPFYYGVLVQAQQKVDLRKIYDFEPMISEDDYIAVQELSNRRIKPYKQKRYTFLPLKSMIVCSFCGNNMYPGASKSRSGKRFLYYRCENKFCTRKKKSIRAIQIFDFIYKFLDKGLNFTEEEYNKYYDKAISLSDEKREKLSIEIHSLDGRLKATEKEIKEIAFGLIKTNINQTVKTINEARLEELEATKEELHANKQKLKSQLTDPIQDKLNIEQFLNLSKNAGLIIQSADAVVKDQISRLIFLNLTANEEKVLSYQAKEPFATLLKQHDKSFSRGERT